MTTRHSRPTKHQLHRLHAVFLNILPRIERHGHIYFRQVRCASTQEECLAEMIALSWRWFVRLVRKGKDPTRFVSAIATFAARAVRSGRRLCGQEKARDVLSPRAQQKHRFAVQTLPGFSTLSGNPVEEALSENHVTPVPDQVAFRLDFPAWLTALSERDRRVVACLVQGERTTDVARTFGLSPGRVSQLRRAFRDDWDGFCA